MLFVYLSLLVVCGGALGGAGARDKPHYPESAHAQLFAEFKAAYSKQYASPQEERHRFTVFKKNLAKINELNAKSGETVYGINQFADLTAEEFRAQYTGLKMDRTQTPVPPPLTNLSIAAPAAFDWRDKGVVTRVKESAQCGSCWAFVAIGSLESNYARKTGKLLEFSEQQLIDCDTCDEGCGGGDPVNACTYLKKLGSMTDTDYPYVAGQGTCIYNASQVVTYAAHCINYSGWYEDDIKKILVEKGPIAVAVDSYALVHYQEGIIDSECDHHKNYDYTVLLVGYGADYWIAKNSWTTAWGEQGYFRMKMGVNCLGFTNNTVLPVEVDQSV